MSNKKEQGSQFWARRNNSVSVNRKKKTTQEAPKPPAPSPERSSEEAKQSEKRVSPVRKSYPVSVYCDPDSSKTVRKTSPVRRFGSRVISESRNKKESSSHSSSKSSSHSIHKKPTKKKASNQSVFKPPAASPVSGVTSTQAASRAATAQRSSSISSMDNKSATEFEDSVREIDRPPMRYSIVAPPGEADCMTAHSPKSVRADDTTLPMRLKKFAKLCEALTLKQIQTEFDSLVKPSPHEYQTFSKIQAKNESLKKNRYSNIYCLDATRVNLKFRSKSVEDTYIHASRVEYANLDNAFIITQGPVTATIGDFWRMIWQENVQNVIQLCKSTENGVKKCAEYFERKKGSYALWGDIYVSTAAVESDATMVKTTLQVHCSRVSRRITHYQWLEWEDCKAPPISNETLFDLLSIVRGDESPVLVHCSAGIGRSGTLVAAEMCLMDMQKGKNVSVLAAVQCLRRFRCQAVQTLDQYLYLHRVVLQYGESNGYLKKEEVLKFYKLYADNIRGK